MDLLVIIVAIGAALAYAGWKTWELFKPGARGCCCSNSKSAGCASCPIAKKG